MLKCAVDLWPVCLRYRTPVKGAFNWKNWGTFETFFSSSPGCLYINLTCNIQGFFQVHYKDADWRYDECKDIDENTSYVTKDEIFLLQAF